MSAEYPRCPYMIVVKTNQYTGNFERELCAYATGALGECEVGQKAAAAFQDEIEEDFWAISDLCEHEADDRGCRRPVSIWNMDGRKYEELAIFLTDKPSDEELKIIAQRIRAYPQYQFENAPSYAKMKKVTLKIKSIKLVKREIKLTETVEMDL